MALISASRFNTLKSKVKAECQRRAFIGSVADYAGTAYDYTNTPDSGKVISKEHYQKNAIPLNAITNAITQDMGVISESTVATLESEVTRLASIDAQASSSGCAASCTGLCQGDCHTGCSGCSGGCSGGCRGCGSGCSGCSGCGSGCASSCTGRCGSTCGNCAGTCSGYCGGHCSDSCTGSIRSTCGD